MSNLSFVLSFFCSFPRPDQSFASELRFLELDPLLKCSGQGMIESLARKKKLKYTQVSSFRFLEPFFEIRFRKVLSSFSNYRGSEGRTEKTHLHVLYLYSEAGHSFPTGMRTVFRTELVQNGIQNRTHSEREEDRKKCGFVTWTFVNVPKMSLTPCTRLSSASLRSRTFQLISLFVQFRASPQFFSFFLTFYRESINNHLLRSVLFYRLLLSVLCVHQASFFCFFLTLNFADGFRNRGRNV